MNQTRKFLSILVLGALFALTFVTPAYAFDGRSGDQVIIAKDEVVNDDLYVATQQFVLDGTVNGDVIAFAQTVTINGTVDGDLMTAAQTVVLNGKVTGAIRMAGSALFVGEKASIGGDIVGAGYSLEVRPGSAIGQDLVFAGGQTLLAGDVVRNVWVATAALELSGKVGGNVKAEVGEPNQGAGMPPTMFGPQSSISVPRVKPGLTIAPSAKIDGNLQYTQTKDLSFPAGVVSGKVSRVEPPVKGNAPHVETAAEKIAKCSLKFVRSSVTLILIGLLLFWLFPVFMKDLSDRLQAKPWQSLGWGALAWAGFYVAVMLVIFAMIVGAIVFGVMTLGQLSGAVIGLGLLTLVTLIVGFVLVTSFVAKLAFGAALGKWIFVRANSPLAEHRYWPMVVGVLITLAVIALFSFPLIPGFLGWLLNFAVVLFGLGALWVWGRERMVRKPA